ncbi:cytochrome P450 76T24-like [Andrographis paniculata]|uniref:cytochrome P450 76T24-like n=1 Tax=Andrographis paniculata TaxID=175694 RepID=UPI0021E7A2D3|nr:cytochrome P450 76T24-like [Andrographis paniculata]
MDFVECIILFLAIAWIVVVALTGARKPSGLPPGPHRVPVIGNILELGSKPHRSLATLAGKYGPVMSLKLGTRTTVVISAPEEAKMVMQKHDLIFSGRSIPGAAETLRHSDFSMAWLPVDHQWRKLRKICKEQMFSAARLDSSQGLRKAKLRQLSDHVGDCAAAGRAVDIGEAAFTTSLNLMSASLFSMDFAKFDSDSSQEMKDVVWGVMKGVGSPNLSDYFPVLKRADPQGILRETEKYFQKLFDIFDDIIDKRMKSRKDKKDDLLEALIDLNLRDETELSLNDIKHLLLDLFVAGADTTSGTVEWAMSELMRRPEKLSRARDEIRGLIGETGEMQESDIQNLPYLQAVVKETFRFHPAAPFLMPRKAETDVEINGYIIPKDCQILINFWASGRNSNVWSDAETFMPERFLEGDARKIDYRGKDFELIPFGAGRRICPGLPLAHRMVHLMLATLVHGFGWKLEEGVKAAEIDVDEKFGLTLQKAKPLRAIPLKL